MRCVYNNAICIVSLLLSDIFYAIIKSMRKFNIFSFFFERCFTVGVNFNANIIIERPQKIVNNLLYDIFFCKKHLLRCFIENKFHVSQMSLADISTMTCVSHFFPLLNKQANNEVIYNSLTAKHEIGEWTNVFIIT